MYNIIFVIIFLIILNKFKHKNFNKRFSRRYLNLLNASLCCSRPSYKMWVDIESFYTNGALPFLNVDLYKIILTKKCGEKADAVKKIQRSLLYNCNESILICFVKCCNHFQTIRNVKLQCIITYGNFL